VVVREITPDVECIENSVLPEPDNEYVNVSAGPERK
jgi:hypothetical protein